MYFVLQSAGKRVGVQDILCVRLSFVRYHRLSLWTTVRPSVMMVDIVRIHMVQRYYTALCTYGSLCVVTFEIHVARLRVLVTSSVWNVSIDVMAC